MSLKDRDIENLFSETFEDFHQVPESRIVRSLRFKLWKADFISLNFRKFNFVYAVVLVSALSSMPFIFSEEKNLQVNASTEIADESFTEIKNEATEVVQSKVEENIENNAESSVAFASFELSGKSGCAPFKIKFKNKSRLAKSYLWNFGDGSIAKVKEPTHIYSKAGTYQARLTIKDNNNNTYNYSQKVVVHKVPESSFDIDVESSLMETRKVVFINKTKGASSYLWKFGDNTTSTLSNNISHEYLKNKPYVVTLIAKTDFGCSDTTTITNRFIEKDYKLVFPTSFRPNTITANDGLYNKSDRDLSIFYPKNNGVDEYSLNIYAPNGTLVFASSNIKQGWNGYYRGRVSPSGTYIFIAQGLYPNGKKFDFKGKVNLILSSYQDNY